MESFLWEQMVENDPAAHSDVHAKGRWAQSRSN